MYFSPFLQWRPSKMCRTSYSAWQPIRPGRSVPQLCLRTEDCWATSANKFTIEINTPSVVTSKQLPSLFTDKERNKDAKIATMCKHIEHHTPKIPPDEPRGMQCICAVTLNEEPDAKEGSSVTLAVFHCPRSKDFQTQRNSTHNFFHTLGGRLATI